jgi:hypothetical protein
VPAAAVIPAPIAYIKVVAVKASVVRTRIAHDQMLRASGHGRQQWGNSNVTVNKGG